MVELFILNDQDKTKLKLGFYYGLNLNQFCVKLAWALYHLRAELNRSVKVSLGSPKYLILILILNEKENSFII